MSPSQTQYENSIAAEMRVYRHCADVHSLPPIFHYWSDRYLRPLFEAFGASTLNSFFALHLNKQFELDDRRVRRFASLGSGNCDLEIHLATQLLGKGHTEFLFDCIDLNPSMLERGRLAARQAGIEEHFAFVQGDLNTWLPVDSYDAAVANQSLHHVVNLENLFSEVTRSLRPGGSFVISDMIGRNGHLRWPEAFDIVHELWPTLPPSYRFNRTARRYEELFEDHDCSGEGFEGVRAQDILPLLIDQFHFRIFVPFANVIDPFIDRSFGSNFGPALSWDREFIDAVHQRDEREMLAGSVKPTHMVAVVSNDAGAQSLFPRHLSPAFCVRHPAGPSGKSALFAAPAYRWEQYPHSAQDELEKACAFLVQSAARIKEQNEWALGLERESAERLDWAHRIESEMEEVRTWALRLETELLEKSAWALRLETEVLEKSAWALSLRDELAQSREALAAFRDEASRLQSELEETRHWARQLDLDLEDKSAWALQLSSELEAQKLLSAQMEEQLRSYTRNPFRLLPRMAVALRSLIARHFRPVRSDYET